MGGSLVFTLARCYIFHMTIEQTIEILPNRRLELDLPFELPLGKAWVELRIIPEGKNTTTEGKTAFGCLQRFADPSKIPSEKEAWGLAR